MGDDMGVSYNYWPEGMTAEDYCDPPDMRECQACGEDFDIDQHDGRCPECGSKDHN
jgi:hypothetical protein